MGASWQSLPGPLSDPPRGSVTWRRHCRCHLVGSPGVRARESGPPPGGTRRRGRPLRIDTVGKPVNSGQARMVHVLLHGLRKPLPRSIRRRTGRRRMEREAAVRSCPCALGRARVGALSRPVRHWGWCPAAVRPISRASRPTRRQFMGGLPRGTPGRRRGTRTRRARGSIRQCTGVGRTRASPSTPTGTLGASASTTTSWAVSEARPGAAPAAEHPRRLRRVVDLDAEHPEDAGVQPLAAAQPRRVVRPIGVVAHQYGLRCLDGRLTVRALRADGEARAAVMGQQVREELKGGTCLVVAVRGALDDGRVGAEGGVVHEDAVPDAAQVDA